MLKSCEQCGKTFKVKPSRANRRFCSQKCMGLWRSENLRGENNPRWKGGNVKLNCEICGEEFETVPARATMASCCSKECRSLRHSKIMRGRPSHHLANRVKKVCKWCEKEFSVKPSHDNRRVFCSVACMGLWSSKNHCGENHHSWQGGWVKVTCEICGRDFEAPPSANRKVCSKKCMGLWMSKNRRGEKHWNWQGGKIKLTCKRCGEEFEVIPSFVDQRFCSRKCMGLWQSENRCGENGANWKGGISFEPYGLDFDDKLKKTIRKRDNYTCAIGGEVWQLGQDKFAVHHINYCKTDNRPENLITLCWGCHSKTNGNRQYWEDFLSPVAIENPRMNFSAPITAVRGGIHSG